MRHFVAVASAIALLAAPVAFAGEVSGPPGDPENPVQNTNETGAPANANSNCAYSGLNDFEDFGQNAAIVQTAADSWKFYGAPKGTPGTACRGGPNESRAK